jgi:hypothetical protein
VDGAERQCKVEARRVDREIVRGFEKTARSAIDFLIVDTSAGRDARAMVVGCKNCGGYFTSDELKHRKPPAHPWPLTPVGARSLANNAASGANFPCPACGQNTLGGAPPPASQLG